MPDFDARSACSVSSLGDGRSDAGAGPGPAPDDAFERWLDGKYPRCTSTYQQARRREKKRAGAVGEHAGAAPPRRKRRPRDDGPPWAPAEDKAVRAYATDPTNRSKETGRIDWARVLDAHPILIKRTPALVKARWERATRPAVATRRPPGCVQIR